MDHVSDTVWIGDTTSLPIPETTEIGTVVTLSHAWRSDDVPDDCRYVYMPLYDNGTNNSGRLKAAIHAAHAAQENSDTLYHCSMAMSRSPLIVAAVLILRGDVGPGIGKPRFDAALDEVRSALGRDVAPHYQLRRQVADATRDLMQVT